MDSLHIRLYGFALITLLLGADAVAARMFFSAAETVGVPKPRFLTVADLDGDGLDDVVVVNSRRSISVLFGSATSATMFDAPHQYRFGRRLRRPAVGDLTGDGIPDIVIPDEANKGVWVVRGTGGRGFAKQEFFDFGMRANSVAIADLDGRGGADLVVGERRTGRVSLRLNSAALRFRPGGNLAVDGKLERVECADLNADLIPEIVGVSGGRSGRITVFPGIDAGSGMTGYSSSRVLNNVSTHADLAFGDFDRDGTADLAVLVGSRGRSTSRIEIALSSPDNETVGSWSVETVCPIQARRRNCGPRGLAASDFDGDGIPDLAVGVRDRAGTSLFGGRRPGALTFFGGRGDTFVPTWTHSQIDRYVRELGSGDFNGDGWVDIVAIAKSANMLQALHNLSSPE